jgi:hypothetical protein
MATTIIVAIIVEMAGLRLSWSFIWIFMSIKSDSWVLAANLDYASFALDYMKHRDGFLYIGMASHGGNMEYGST